MRTTTRLSPLLLLALVSTACGGDPAASAAAAPVDGQLDSFCDAVAGLFSLPTDASGAEADALVERLEATAPAEVGDDLGTVLEANGGGGLEAYADPAYLAADAAVADAVLDDCGLDPVRVDAADYAFVGLPNELAAGRVVFEVTNTSTTELHELSLLRKNDDVQGSFEELFELPDDEASAMVSPYGTTLVGPEARTVMVTDLTPGEYLVACFLPVGSQDPAPDSEPHLVRGMYQTLNVTG